jgi:biopolymer transport protein ExbB
MVFLKDYLDYFIFGVLGVMSFFLVWYVIERYLYYRNINVSEFKSHNKLNVALTNRLTTISIIGVNAPYVGLLGTVIGILITFWDIGQGGKIEPGAIMLGLALALKATAAGLAVAIPAVMFYNALLRKVDVLISDWRDIQQAG